MDRGAWWAAVHVVTSLSLFTFLHWRRKWQPTPVFLPGESQGQGSLVGCHLWGHTESDTTEATQQQQQQQQQQDIIKYIIRLKRRTKRYQNWQESNITVFAGNMAVYVAIAMELTKKKITWV